MPPRFKRGLVLCEWASGCGMDRTWDAFKVYDTRASVGGRFPSNPPAVRQTMGSRRKHWSSCTAKGTSTVTLAIDDSR